MKRKTLLTSVFIVFVATFAMACVKGKDAGKTTGESENTTSVGKVSADGVWDGD